IRDRNVTGVQTCALPILYRPLMNQLISLYRSRHPIGFFKRSDALHVAVPTEDMTAYRREHRVELEEYRENVRVEQMTDQLAAERSEERRVGKECGARWGL